MASRYRSFYFLLCSLRGALLISILVFLALMLIAVGLTNLYGGHTKVRAVDAVNAGLAADLQHLRTAGNLVAQNPMLHEYLIEGDSYKILGVLASEKEHRNIGLMGVANKDGTIISRTRTVSNRGENVFLVSPQGRALAEGKLPASIEASSFDPTQVLMTTGRPIVSGTTTIGALFANYLLDDTYAETFKRRYLFDGVHVVFYTREYGIYGSSIRSEEERSVLSSYFNVDSDWIKREKTGDIVRFDSGTYYRVENIIFPGIEQSPGGVLVFIPYYGYALPIRAIIVVLTLAVFAFIARRAHKFTRKDHRNRYYYWSMFTAGIILVGLIYTINHLVFVRYVSLHRVPYILYNSTLRLQPESGVFDKGFERPVSVLVDTGDESINAISTHIAFDPQQVDVVDLDVENSICTNMLEKTVDIPNKEIRLACVISAPGFSGSIGHIANIIVHPRSVGEFNLVFNDDTQILANDGLGTNVLRQSINGSYHVVPMTLTATSSGYNKNIGNKPDNIMPVVFSPSHPNSMRWYNSPRIDFVWSPVSGDGYVYALDDSTSTIPRFGLRTADTKVSVTAPSDGIYYFHIASVLGDRVGPTRHYKVMIDTTPPVDVIIRASEDDVKMGDVVRFEFSGRDTVSGLQNTMYININNNTFLPVGRQTYVPFVDVGDVPVKLRIYDKAGNYTEREKVVSVSGTLLQRVMRGR